MIPIRLYAYAAIAAAIGLLLWHDHWISRKYKAAHAEVVQVKATLIAEQESRKHEREINAKIDQQLLDANKALDLERAKPLPRLQCRRLPVSASSLPGTATASAVDPTATEGHDSEADARDFDPSADLLQFAVEAQENRDSLAACQMWIRSR
jgi:hypothetical protein